MLTNLGRRRLFNQRIMGKNNSAINIENTKGIIINDKIFSK